MEYGRCRLIMFLFLIMPVLNRNTLRLKPSGLFLAAHISITDYPQIFRNVRPAQLDRLLKLLWSLQHRTVCILQMRVSTGQEKPGLLQSNRAAQKDPAIEEPVKEKTQPPNPCFDGRFPEPGRMNGRGSRRRFSSEPLTGTISSRLQHLPPMESLSLAGVTLPTWGSRITWP